MLRTFIFWDTSVTPKKKIFEVECKYTDEAEAKYKEKFGVSPLGKKNISCTIKKEVE